MDGNPANTGVDARRSDHALPTMLGKSERWPAMHVYNSPRAIEPPLVAKVRNKCAFSRPGAALRDWNFDCTNHYVVLTARGLALCGTVSLPDLLACAPQVNLDLLFCSTG